MSFHQITSTGTVSVNSSETMKFQASQGGSGTVVMDDEEIVAQSGSYSSDRFARMTPSQAFFGEPRPSIPLVRYGIFL
jgi:hypothetical protein